MSSAAEVQSHLYVAFDQDYINQQHFDNIYAQAEKTAKLFQASLSTYVLTNAVMSKRNEKNERNYRNQINQTHQRNL